MKTHYSFGASSLAPLLISAILASWAQADIYQWEYINNNPFLPIQQSTTLCPDGAGVTAAPGADLSYRDLTQAYLERTDLTGASAIGTNFVNADLSGAFLKNVNMSGAMIGGADLN